MGIRDDSFDDLVARATQATEEFDEIQKRRKLYVKELRAWSRTGALSAEEKKLVRKLTKGFPRAKASGQARNEGAAGQAAESVPAASASTANGVPTTEAVAADS